MQEKRPKLDERLAVIASMVRDGARCADIGTDHGYLIAWLAVSGRIPNGYASDIHQKPLEKAAFTLSEYGVSDRVKLVLCDGLDQIPENAVDDIVIAGMGGDTIWQILDKPGWTRNPDMRFILQPMTKPERLRRNLYKAGFCILEERAVIAGDFPYSVMCTAYTGQTYTVDDTFAYCGLLLERQDEAARRYVDKVRRLIAEKVDGLRASGRQSDALFCYEELLRQLKGSE